MSLEIRRARPDELDAVARFYERFGYAGQVSDDAIVFVADQDGAIVGLLRLESEFGVTVLRGVRVLSEYQHQGIGTKLLRAVANHLGPESCYCVLYSHLTGFYGQIGFAETPLDDAPPHLRERIAEYRAGRRDVLLMVRSPAAAAR